jgi:hypothetical protein
MSTLTFTDLLRSEVARMQSLHPERAGEIGRAHAAIVEGHVVALDADNGQVLSRNGHTWYATNGTCVCPAAVHGKGCRHLQAWKLYQHIAKLHAALHVQGAPCDEEHVPVDVPCGVEKRWIETISGKPFIKFEGLRHLAEEAGLVELTTISIQVSLELAVCQSTARFKDGRVFTDIGDATPQNVKPHMKPHFIRLAATRASARALRRALNIDACSLEELAE